MIYMVLNHIFKKLLVGNKIGHSTIPFTSVNNKIEISLKAQIATKVVCFSRLLKCLRSLYDKQCGPRSDCSCRSSLIWVHLFASILRFVNNVRQLFTADDFLQTSFSDAFFLGALRDNICTLCLSFQVYFHKTL